MATKFVIIILLFFGQVLCAEGLDLSINGEGRFISEEGDSLPFIKEQLLYNAFQDVITRYLKTQGLDANLFWEKRDKRFDSFIKPIEKEIIENYQTANIKPTDGKLTLENQKRLKKLEKKASFGMLNRIIKSYSINSMTRAQNMPNVRYISIAAQVDSNLLNQIYFNYVSPKKLTKGVTLYLMPLFSLSNMSWSDTGAGTMKDFTSVVSDHWKKYLENDLKQQINEIILLEEGSQNDLNNILKTKRGGQGFLEITDSDKGKLEEGFLLLINIKMKKTSEKILLKKKDIEIGLNFSLVDMRNNKIISFSDLPKNKASFSTENYGQLSSSMATSVYRMPLEEFTKIKKEIFLKTRDSNLVYLKVGNIKTIEDLFTFQNTLKVKGVPFQLSSKLFSLSPNEGFLEFEFNGNQEQIEKFLKEIEKEHLFDGREVVFEKDSGNYSMVIKQPEGSPEETNKKRVVL